MVAAGIPLVIISNDRRGAYGRLPGEAFIIQRGILKSTSYDAKCRGQLAEIACIRTINVPLSLLSGSLPPSAEPQLQHAIGYSSITLTLMARTTSR